MYGRRAAGAGGEILANVAGCASRGRAPAPPLPLDAMALPARYDVPAGAPASVRVQVRRGDTPQRAVPLLLRGSRSLLSVDDDRLTAMLAFKLVRVGRMELTIASGATAVGVPVDIIRRR